MTCRYCWTTSLRVGAGEEVKVQTAAEGAKGDDARQPSGGLELEIKREGVVEEETPGWSLSVGLVSGRESETEEEGLRSVDVVDAGSWSVVGVEDGEFAPVEDAYEILVVLLSEAEDRSVGNAKAQLPIQLRYHHA